jgi:hypothetical protein
MNNYTFIINNKEYKRINKTAAKKAYINNKNVVLCPCNLRPGGPWSPEVTVNYNNRDETEQDTPANVYFDKVLMYFEYYNCINTETGKYTAFYIEL